MKLAALAFAALAVMAVAVDVSENIHELDDDLAMVEVMHGAGGACDTEIRAAKAKCGERLAYFKKIHESSCGDKDLARVMSRIKRNHGSWQGRRMLCGGVNMRSTMCRRWPKRPRR